MQSKKSRAALVVAAAAIAVVAFLVLRPGDDDEQAPTPAAEQVGQANDGGANGGEAERMERERQQRPRSGGNRETGVTEIEIEDGDVVGGVQEISVERGDRVGFTVVSDTPDEIHVHGYELTERVEPGEPARFSFPAELEGIYEVEAHDIGHVVIAELRVTPS